MVSIVHQTLSFDQRTRTKNRGDHVVRRQDSDQLKKVDHSRRCTPSNDGVRTSYYGRGTPRAPADRGHGYRHPQLQSGRQALPALVKKKEEQPHSCHSPQPQCNHANQPIALRHIRTSKQGSRRTSCLQTFNRTPSRHSHRLRRLPAKNRETKKTILPCLHIGDDYRPVDRSTPGQWASFSSQKLHIIPTISHKYCAT